jgi:hypothetical protein
LPSHGAQAPAFASHGAPPKEKMNAHESDVWFRGEFYGQRSKKEFARLAEDNTGCGLPVCLNFGNDGIRE